MQAELDFFDDVTDVSGQLYKVPKDQRKGAAVDILRKLQARPLQKHMHCTRCCVNSTEGSAVTTRGHVRCKRSMHPTLCCVKMGSQ